MAFISTILFVFHLEISGKEFNEEHPEKRPVIFYTLFIFHFEISGIEIKLEQL